MKVYVVTRLLAPGNYEETDVEVFEDESEANEALNNYARLRLEPEFHIANFHPKKVRTSK